MSMGRFHYTKSTVEASIWCNRCNKETLWRIADGRRQYCIPCYERPKPAPEQPAAEQINLFTKGN
jgi:hypothetical protein